MSKAKQTYVVNYKKEIEEDVFVDRSVKIKMDMNALCELEDVMDMKIPNIGEMVQERRLGIKEVRAMLWAGLLHQNPDITMKEAGDILTGAGFAEALKVVIQAMGEALTGGKTPEQLEKEAKEAEGSEAPKN